MDQLVHGFDVLDDDVIPGIKVFVTAVVEGAIQESALVVTKVLRHGLSKSRAVSRGQLSTPHCATGWIPPRCRRSLTLSAGILSVRNLRRLCLALFSLCFIAGILLRRPAGWSMPRSLMTGGSSSRSNF